MSSNADYPGLTASELIQRTYAIQESQISGVQPWMNSESFDITAKAGREQVHPTRATLSMFINAVSRCLGCPLHDEASLTGAAPSRRIL